MKDSERAALNQAAESPGGVDALRFISCTGYTTFRAEYAFKGDDIVFHFYRTAEFSGDSYWEDTFPSVLSDVAIKEYADYPTVRAARVREFGIDSWWMEARGFATVGIPDLKVTHFYDALDAALESKMVR